MKVLTLTILTAGVLLGACDPLERRKGETMVCRSFSFVASGKSEITEARKLFYEAAMHYGTDFSDGIRWGGPAIFHLGGERFVLSYGDGSYLRTLPEPTLELKITSYGEEIIGSGFRSAPCSSSGLGETLKKIEAQFSEKWRITKIENAPYVVKYSSERK